MQFSPEISSLIRVTLSLPSNPTWNPSLHSSLFTGPQKLHPRDRTFFHVWRESSSFSNVSVEVHSIRGVILQDLHVRHSRQKKKKNLFYGRSSEVCGQVKIKPRKNNFLWRRRKCCIVNVWEKFMWKSSDLSCVFRWRNYPCVQVTTLDHLSFLSSTGPFVAADELSFVALWERFFCHVKWILFCVVKERKHTAQHPCKQVGRWIHYEGFVNFQFGW